MLRTNIINESLQRGLKFFWFLTFQLVVLNFAFADGFSGKVVGISDGDTISVMHNGKAEKVRLYGIDCPEKAQAFGEKAKQQTSGLAFGKVVTVNVKDTDRYGRTIGEVILPEGRSLNKELVLTGFCWWYQNMLRKILCLRLLKQMLKRIGLVFGSIPILCHLGSLEGGKRVAKVLLLLQRVLILSVTRTVRSIICHTVRVIMLLLRRIGFTLKVRQMLRMQDSEGQLPLLSIPLLPNSL